MPAYGAQYGRLDDSELIEHLWYKSDASTVLATVEKSYEPTCDLVGYVECDRGGHSPVSAAVTSAGRPTSEK